VYAIALMRRVFQTPAQKRRSARRARYQLSRRKRQFQKRAQRTTPAVRPKSGSRLPGFRPLPAPSIFSLVENPDETLKYFRGAHDWLRNRTRTRFDLTKVDRVTPDAIALLVANVKSKDFTHGTPIAGDEPADEIARKMFDESGFYDQVHVNDSRQRNRKQLLLHRITHHRVENIEARDAGRFASAHVYGDGRRLRPLYEVLIECMANTNNHANTSRRGYYDWWLFVYNDPNARRSIFTFLDLGVGIFQSLPMKRFWGDPLRSMGLKGNLSVLPKLLAGEISSRTGKPERGKGMPKISNLALGGSFTSFIMISNDVYADLLNSRSRLLKEPFHGTLFVFEISNPSGA
jgi:hypothetical protein